MDKNWRNGSATVKMIPFNGENYFHNTFDHVKDVLTMNGKSVVVGFYSGEIKIFDRKKFSHEKVINIF